MKMKGSKVSATSIKNGQFSIDFNVKIDSHTIRGLCKLEFDGLKLETIGTFASIDSAPILNA